MAGETLFSNGSGFPLASALSQIFDQKLHKQWNRLAVTAGLIEAKAGRGKNAAWDVEFSGATAGTVAEGSDVSDSEYAVDANVPAVLDWAHYRSSFKVSETEIDAAISSMGSADALMEIFDDRMEGSANKLASVINADLLTGTGTDGSGNSTLIGLFEGPLEVTGNYAGIGRSAFSEWQGNVYANGSVARPLSTDLLYQLEQGIYTASGEIPDCIVTSPGVYRKYAGLFESVRRLDTDGRGPLQYEAGAAELFWKGIPVLRDRNMPTGKLLMLKKKNLQVKYLPRHIPPQDSVQFNMEQIAGTNGDELKSMTSIPARVAILAKTGDSVKVSMKVTLQMCVLRPNSMGYISDISET